MINRSYSKWFRNNIWYILLVVTIFFSFWFRGFIASSDAASSWFSPFYNLKQLVYNWDNALAIGSYLPNNFASFFLRLYYSFFSIISTNPSILQRIVWITFFSLSGLILMFYISKILNNKFYSFVSVLFIFFNPISQYFLWGKQHWAYYLIFPYTLSILLYIRFCEKRNFNYLIGISFIWLIFGFGFNQPAYTASLFIILTTIFLFTMLKSSFDFKFIKLNLMFLILFILLNFVYLLPLILGGSQIISITKPLYANADPIPILRDLQNENFFYSFINLTKGYGNLFTPNVLFLLIWVLFFVLIFFYAVIYHEKGGKSKEYLVIFSILLLLFIFFIKGISTPFSKLSEFIYSFDLMYIFRDFKDKFAIGYAICLSFIFIFLLNYKTKLLKYFLIFISLFSVYLFFFNFWLPDNFRYSEDIDYFGNLNISTDYQSRVLNLPLVDYSFFYLSNPYYTGDNPLRNIINKEVIYSAFLKEKNTLFIKSILYNKNITPDDFESYLKKYNIQYIINNKNSYVAQDINPYNYDYHLIEKYNFIEKIYTDNYLDLYYFSGFYPRIYSENIFFKKINPTKYGLYFTDLKFSQNLSFLESYHKDWKLYLVKNSSSEWCKPLEFHNNTNTTECERTQKFFEGEELIYLWKKPIFDNTHTRVYDYANQWTIDSDYIKSHYSKDYYTENVDGSINIELVMYFKPQSYFYLGLIISGTTVIFCIIYLIYNWRKDRNKNPECEVNL